eukprot:COSAG04_NODE_3714_length_2584_cov_1.424206_1_plen_49_part_10
MRALLTVNKEAPLLQLQPLSWSYSMLSAISPDRIPGHHGREGSGGGGDC